jgi:type I restriction-modification system DNA methylase subunit
MRHFKAQDEYEKEFEKIMDKLTYNRMKWEVWADLIFMMAASISNALEPNPAKREKREKEYMRCVERCGGVELPAQAFCTVVEALEQNPDQDFLGSLYMRFELGSHWHGQFFTPYNLCAMMAKTQLGQQDYTIDNVKPITVCDCACGGGALLIAAAHEYRKAIQHTGLNAQNYVSLYAQDLSQVSAMMCYVQLSLLGFAAKVKLGDSLLHPLTKEDNGPDIWYTPMWFSDIWQYRRLMQRMDKIMIGSSSADV